jgi:hypothetical protein
MSTQIPISLLPSLPTIDGNGIIPISSGSTTYNITMASVDSYIKGLSSNSIRVFSGSITLSNTSSYSYTASFASGSGVSALSSSYALSSSFSNNSISASYANTASYAAFAYATNPIAVNNVQNAFTASYLSGSILNNGTASYAMVAANANRAISSSNADTASYALTASNGYWTASYNSNIYYNSGKVGINNNTPLNTLDVVGNIKATAGITGSLLGSASYASSAYTASYSNSSSVANTASYCATSSYILPNASFIKGFAMVTGSNANNKGTDSLTVVSGYNITSVTPLGSLRVYSGQTQIQYCWGVTFSNPINTTNYIVVGNGWEVAGNNGAENASVFLPQTASILNNRTTSAFTMSAQGNWDGSSGETWGMNFQVLGY